MQVALLLPKMITGPNHFGQASNLFFTSPVASWFVGFVDIFLQFYLFIFSFSPFQQREVFLKIKGNEKMRMRATLRKVPKQKFSYKEA